MAKRPVLHDIGSEDPSQAPIPVTPSTNSPEQYQRLGDEMPTSFMDGLKAQLQYTGENFPTVQAVNWWERQQAESQDQNLGVSKISADQANQMFPVRDRPFTESIYPDVAQMISQDAQRRHELMNVVSHSPSNAAAGSVRFVGSTLMSLADPLSLGAAIAGGAAFGVAGRAAGLDESLLFKSAEGLSGGERFLQDAAHAAAGNLALEPITAGLSLSDQQDYSMSDALKNMATFSFGYAGVHGLVRWASPHVSRFLGRTPEAERAAGETAIAQLATDRAVDVKPITDQVIRERSGQTHVPSEVVGGAGDYEYRAISDSADAAGRRYYVGADRSLGDLHNSNHGPIEGDYGPGIYQSDNPWVANGQASSHFSSADGRVFETKLNNPDLHLIDLDKPLPDKAAAVIEGVAHELGIELPKDASGKEALDAIRNSIDTGKAPEDSFHSINDALQSQGFDGYRHAGGDFMGEKNQPHNIVQVFDKNPDTTPVEQTGEFIGDAKATPSLTPEEIRQVSERQQSPDNNLTYSADEARAFKEFVENPPKEMDLPDVEKIEKETLDTINELRSQEVLSDEDNALIDQLEELTHRAADENTAAKAALVCAGKDLLE